MLRTTPSSENNGVWLTPTQMNRLAFTAAHKTILNQLWSQPIMW